MRAARRRAKSAREMAREVGVVRVDPLADGGRPRIRKTDSDLVRVVDAARNPIDAAERMRRVGPEWTGKAALVATDVAGQREVRPGRPLPAQRAGHMPEVIVVVADAFAIGGETGVAVAPGLFRPTAPVPPTARPVGRDDDAFGSIAAAFDRGVDVRRTAAARDDLHD